jgi:hypothetical protein
MRAANSTLGVIKRPALPVRNLKLPIFISGRNGISFQRLYLFLPDTGNMQTQYCLEINNIATINIC